MIGYYREEDGELVVGPRFVKGKLQLMMPWRLERACSSLLLQDKGSARNTLDTLAAVRAGQRVCGEWTGCKVQF